MSFDPERHNRRSIRLKGYDYTQPGAYFVTICTLNRVYLFGGISGDEMYLNENGKIVRETWHELPKHYASIELDAFVVMPNYMHAIISIEAYDVGAGFKPAPTEFKQHGLSEIIRGFKTFSARRINQQRNTPGVSIWQRNYWEHVIRNERTLSSVRLYIVQDPMRWEVDRYNVNASGPNQQAKELWQALQASAR
jgi:putative transposase